jgi:hypothetical protein
MRATLVALHLSSLFQLQPHPSENISSCVVDDFDSVCFFCTVLLIKALGSQLRRLRWPRRLQSLGIWHLVAWYYVVPTHMASHLRRQWSLCASCPSPPGRFLVLISVTGWVHHRAIVQMERFLQLFTIHRECFTYSLWSSFYVQGYKCEYT